MINDSANFCTWMYVVGDDIWLMDSLPLPVVEFHPVPSSPSRANRRAARTEG
jgi:hypothetical protein